MEPKDLPEPTYDASQHKGEKPKRRQFSVQPASAAEHASKGWGGEVTKEVLAGLDTTDFDTQKAREEDEAAVSKALKEADRETLAKRLYDALKEQGTQFLTGNAEDGRKALLEIAELYAKRGVAQEERSLRVLSNTIPVILERYNIRLRGLGHKGLSLVVGSAFAALRKVLGP